MKALDVGNRAVPWRTIEVRRQPSGRPTVSLHGAAETIARRKGVARIELSLTHESRYASALVVAFVVIDSIREIVSTHGRLPSTSTLSRTTRASTRQA